MTSGWSFRACDRGIVPRWHSTHFNVQYIHWRKIRQWCEDQGWVMNVDFVASSDFEQPWYFRTTEHQVLFTLRWA